MARERFRTGATRRQQYLNNSKMNKDLFTTTAIFDIFLPTPIITELCKKRSFAASMMPLSIEGITRCNFLDARSLGLIIQGLIIQFS